MYRALFTILFFGCATPVGEKGDDSGSVRGPGDLSLVGTTCDEGGIFDCVLECWVPEARNYIGDGECDDGARGPIFNCAQMSYDNGDCASDETTGDGSTSGGSTAGETGGSTGGGTTGESGGGTTGETGGGASGGTSGGTSGGASGETGGGTSGGTTGETGGGTGGSVTSCTTEQEIGFSDSSGVAIFTAPAGSPGYFDCSGTCWPVEGTDGFTGTDGLSYGGAIGNGVCEDGTAPEGYVAPDYNCAEWEYDGGDCL